MSAALERRRNALVGNAVTLWNRLSFALEPDQDPIVVFNTAAGTENLGDQIIMHYCSRILRELWGERDFFNISTHRIPEADEEAEAKRAKYKFVCGTNLLTSHIEQWWNWRLPDGFRRKLPYRNAILLGAGWGVYQDECSEYTRFIYKSLLNPSLLHSVRDSYTEAKLRSAGITNVINTGCPTMWRLTPEFCAGIPQKKAENVITTLTDYRRDPERDAQLLEILSRNYRRVFLWLQGQKDEEYLSTLPQPENLTLIPRSLAAYETALMQGGVDYVGTRLHAGIFALNHGVRSIIVSVDNRAAEIAKDTCLPILPREELAQLEQRIQTPFSTDIRIPQDNIDRFLRQFGTKRG